MTDPIQRLREVVEVATPGEWSVEESICPTIVGPQALFPNECIADVDYRPAAEGIANAALIVASTRLVRALVEPGMVEKVARAIAKHHGFDPDRVRDHSGRPAGTPGADVTVYPTWTAFQSEAASIVSLLAYEAIGGGDG